MIPSDAQGTAGTPVVPIESLFFPDQGPHVVERAPNPPITVGGRLRADLGAHAGTLRALVQRARAGTADAGIAAEASALLAAAGAVMRSYGLHNGAALLAELHAPEGIDLLRLAGWETAAVLMENPGGSGEQLETAARLGLLRRGIYAAVARGMGRGFQAQPAVRQEPDAAPAAQAAPASPAARHAGVRASRGLAETLDAGISALDALVTRPLAAPVAIPEAAVVPIDSLLYRGPRALQRAMEVRDELRRTRAAGGAPDEESLEELFDLLDLAARG